MIEIRTFEDLVKLSESELSGKFNHVDNEIVIEENNEVVCCPNVAIHYWCDKFIVFTVKLKEDLFMKVSFDEDIVILKEYFSDNKCNFPALLGDKPNVISYFKNGVLEAKTWYENFVKKEGDSVCSSYTHYQDRILKPISIKRLKKGKDFIQYLNYSSKDFNNISVSFIMYSESKQQITDFSIYFLGKRFSLNDYKKNQFPQIIYEILPDLSKMTFEDCLDLRKIFTDDFSDVIEMVKI